MIKLLKPDNENTNFKFLVKILASILLLVIITFIATKYSEDRDVSPSVNTHETSLVFNNEQVEIITFDGCQYLYLATNKGIIFTHKGNCVNRTHYNHVRDMAKNENYSTPSIGIRSSNYVTSGNYNTFMGYYNLFTNGSSTKTINNYVKK